mgnify:CR=1 FL=1|jgi:PAS domain S-box
MNVLLLEDSEIDAGLTKRGLLNAFPNFMISVAPTLHEARNLLKSGTAFDLALLDMKLPDGNGLDLLIEIRETGKNMAIIMLTGSGNEETAVAAFKAGANDYLVKQDEYILKLPNVIESTLRNHQRNLQKTATKIHVLYIEHNSADINLTIRHIKQFAPYIQLEIVHSAEEALSILEYKNRKLKKHDVLLLDYRLPGLNGIEFIKIIRQERKLNLPIILITGQGNEEIAMVALTLGANEYLVKDEQYLNRLPSIVINAFQQHELQEKQDALIESEARYRLLAENSGDVIFTLDKNLNITYISPAVKTQRGFDPEEVIKQKLSEILTPKSHKIFVNNLTNALTTNDLIDPTSISIPIMELEMMKSDSNTIWAEVKTSLLLDSNNKPSGILGVSRDITDRKIASDQLRKLSRAVEQSPVSIIITDLSGNIEYVNPRFTEQTGYTSLEVIGQNPRFLKSGYTTIPEYKKLWEVITSGGKWRGELYNKHKDGSFFWETATISGIKNSKGETTHFIAVKEDITEKKKYEAELLLAKDKAEESDRLKTAFLHNISHEIRTPMNAIVGFSKLINIEDLSAEKRNNFADIIVKSSEQLLSIISDIISISTIEAGQEKIHFEHFDLNSTLLLLFNQFQIKAKELGISLKLAELKTDIETDIYSDRIKLVQILTNLIGNALKFTNHGFVRFGCNWKQDYLEFFVEDSGIGIAPEMHEEIFKRFGQVKSDIPQLYGGSGLGLSISKAYVELLDGKMWLTSTLGKGTTFFFTLPYKPKVKTNLN